MSAITGICDLRAIVASASASSWVGHATRTIWQPEAVSSAICCSVAPMSAVRVVVIDCTDTGASPPTATDPTWIFRLLRRSASLSGTDGIPSEMAVIRCASPKMAQRIRQSDYESQPYGTSHDSGTTTGTVKPYGHLL